MVGDILRGEREKQGLTIDDVARETSIRDTYLEAIEKGEYDALPGDVYAKGFIRNYSRFLQIDGDVLLQKYDEERNISKPVQPIDKQNAVESKKSHGIFGHNKSKSKLSAQETAEQPVGSAQPDKPKKNLFAAGDAYRNSLEQEEKSGSKKFMILLGVMVLFLGGVYVAFMDDGTETAPKEEPVQAEAQQQPAPVEKKYDGVEITAKALEDCWISIKVDGKNVFEGTIAKGKDMSWQGKESVEILAGNAGGIQITYNGKDVGTLGEAGQVAEHSFKKNEDVKPAEPAVQQSSAQPVYEERRSQHNNYYSAPVEPAAPQQAPAPQEVAPQPAATAPAAEPAPAVEAPQPAAVPEKQPVEAVPAVPQE